MKDLKMTDSGEKITKQKLDQFQTEFNLTFPEYYKEFMLKHNGGYSEISAYGNPNEDGTSIQVFKRISLSDCTVEELIDDELIPSSRETVKYLQIVEEVIPKYLYPFGITAGGGHFCFSMRKKDFGSVYLFFTDGTAEKPTLLSPSFKTFIEELEDPSNYEEAGDY